MQPLADYTHGDQSDCAPKRRFEFANIDDDRWPLARYPWLFLS